MQIHIGHKNKTELTVTPETTAQAMRSGLLPVFSTPYMIAMMENCASDSLAQFLDEGYSSVGTHLDIRHLSATPIGMRVYAQSIVTAVDGRKISFDVAAYDESGKIGEGRHERVIIEIEKFMAKCNGKIG